MEKKRFAIWPRCRCLPTLPSSTASSPDRIYLAATGTRTSTRTPYDTARWTSRNHAGRDLVTPPSLPRGIYICATVKNWLRSNDIPKMGFALMARLICGRSLECHFSRLLQLQNIFHQNIFFLGPFSSKYFFLGPFCPWTKSTSLPVSFSRLFQAWRHRSRRGRTDGDDAGARLARRRIH